MGSKLGVKRGHYRLRHGYRADDPKSDRPHLYSKYGGVGEPKPEKPKPEQPKRPVHPNTSDRPYDDDEREFMMSMDTYKRSSGHMFPQWSEVLGVIKGLGYHK